MKNVFIVGSKGIPAKYGGFETFVEELTKNQKTDQIKYHVSCLADNNAEFEHNGARCFNVKTLNIGPAKAVYYDMLAVKRCINYIKKNNIPNATLYILACRIGPFMWYYKNQLKQLGIKLYVNPDGHEWKRAKWSAPVRMYWKISERLMVKHADLLICDSINIENYIKESYDTYKPSTKFIAYGADVRKSTMKSDNETLIEWYDKFNLSAKNYYLVVGRFVPENNYEIMIHEFMKSNTKKSFVLITNVSDSFLNELRDRTHFDKDERVKFVGTVYEQELLKKIRENAYGYFHGHEVGGTNPSLLESLASTDLNLLLDVGFNKEVAENSALYWNKNDKNLASLIEMADQMSQETKSELGYLAKERILNHYSWEHIVSEYEKILKSE